MIFLLNTTNQKIKLKAEDIDSTTTGLIVCTESGSELMVASTKDADIAKAMLDRFGTEEEIKNKNSRHNFRIDDKRLFLDRYGYPTGDDERTGLEGSVKMVAVPFDAPLPERYSVGKDMIVVIHKASNNIEMDDENLNGPTVWVSDEQINIAATVFVVKWFNWGSLKQRVCVRINGKDAYELTQVENKKQTGKMVNAVRNLRRDRAKAAENQK